MPVTEQYYHLGCTVMFQKILLFILIRYYSASIKEKMQINNVI